MKITPLFYIAALLGSAVAVEPMTDRITDEELSARQADSESPIAVLELNLDVSGKVIRPAKQSIIAQSVILSDGTNWTLIPRGAVLHQPPAQKAKVNARPIGNLLSWSRFLSMNRAWLSSEEVSLPQAKGERAIDDSHRAHWTKQDKVIIAVHFGGPISVSAPPVVITETADNS